MKASFAKGSRYERRPGRVNKKRRTNRVGRKRGDSITVTAKMKTSARGKTEPGLANE